MTSEIVALNTGNRSVTVKVRLIQESQDSNKMTIRWTQPGISLLLNLVELVIICNPFLITPKHGDKFVAQCKEIHHKLVQLIGKDRLLRLIASIDCNVSAICLCL